MARILSQFYFHKTNTPIPPPKYVIKRSQRVNKAQGINHVVKEQEHEIINRYKPCFCKITTEAKGHSWGNHECVQLLYKL